MIKVLNDIIKFDYNRYLWECKKIQNANTIILTFVHVYRKH